MFEKSEVAEYYDTTEIHYRKWWNLDKHLSLHYGIWDKNTKPLEAALNNTNQLLLRFSNISESDKVLDTGCLIGGAAFFTNKSKKAQVIGISFSKKQVDKANAIAYNRGLKDIVEFEGMDFTNTNFPSETFDVFWAYESVCHAQHKPKFIEESFRILKEDERLILFDLFINKENQNDKHKWKQTWAVPNLIILDQFTKRIDSVSFKNIRHWDYTKQVTKSALRLYYATLLGALPSELYNLFHPNVRYFAKKHYKCGYYQ